jgi:signal transduction histidine kinase
MAQPLSQDTMPGGHPLEMFAWFRRWPRSLGRDLLYTLIWSTAFALALSLLGIMITQKVSARSLWANWTVSNCIGYIIHLEYVIGGRLLGTRVRSAHPWIRVSYNSIVPISGVILGYWLGLTLLNVDVGRYFSDSSAWIGVALTSLLVAGVLSFIYIRRDQETLAEARFERERTRVTQIERHALEANLRMLQAQIEPHFLFNTLANVVSLIDPAPDRAKRMLEDFIDYLRSSLRATRSDRLSLRQEIDLIESYLRVIEVRMGNRLRHYFDVPDELLALPFPPMLLQPLVENAIRHGLEPKVDGGEVRISARLDQTELRIVVADTGLGMSGAPIEGVGLSNVRQRLASIFGEAARLEFSSNQPQGAQVTLIIPLSAVDLPPEQA